CRATADCNKFAKRIVIADFQISRLALIFQVLRLLTDRAGGIKLIARTGAHRSAKRDVMLEPAVWAEHDVGSDYAIRPDDRAHTDFRTGINDRGRMNLRVAHACQHLTSILSPSFNGRGGKSVAVACDVRLYPAI